VITSDGIVGKVFRVYPASSLVLEINESSSGAGVILEKSRLQGILKGSPTGQTYLANIMADEKIEPGERILTSGGDRVYPKGMAVGTVSRVSPAGTFLNVEVKPSAQLNRLEEVLVITRIVEQAPKVTDESAPLRAIDILAQRLPSVPPPKPPEKKAPATAQPKPAGTTSKPNAEASPPASVPPETAGQSPAGTKRAPSADKNAASAKAAVEAVKPETPAKDTPR
jgi:rod shape-determining protein MreC